MVKMGAIAFAARTARRVAAPAAVAAAITTLLLANSCIGENPPYSDVVSDAQVSDSQVSEGDGSSDGGSAVDGSSDSAAPANPRTLFGGFSSSFCAIKKDKRLRCWGSRLGLHLMRADGGTSAIPVDLPFDAPIESVSMGILHACAISAADKGLYCWGVNAGWAAPPEAVRDRAERVASPEQFSAVAAGFGFTCAITTPKRSVRCFGTDEFGRLGPGPGLEVGGFDDVVSIGVGLRHACAVRATGEVTCWGGNHLGQLGRGNADNDASSPTPVPVGFAGAHGDIDLVTSSYGQNFARDKTGAWFAWGNNFATNLAIATPGGVPRATPTFVEPAGGAGSRIVAVAPSAFTTCVLTAAGGVKCVGANQSWDSLPMGAGMLGSGSTDPALQVATLVDVVGLERGVTELVAGSESFCAKKADGAILCWGQNLWEQGDGGVESDLFIGELGAGLLATTGLAVPVPVVGFPE